VSIANLPRLPAAAAAEVDPDSAVTAPVAAPVAAAAAMAVVGVLNVAVIVHNPFGCRVRVTLVGGGTLAFAMASTTST
jgi:hypothetical protein